MKRKDLAARRIRNRELAETDAALRCAFCRQPLPERSIVRWADGKKFCNDECDASELEREQVMAR